MDSKELLKKVRKIEIKTRGLSRHIFAGHYHSAFKGRGMAFSEVREYQYGDDIRSIDWNVTARFNHPFIKIFEEERELTVMLLIDVSKSNTFGSQQLFKREIITEIAAVLAFSAISNNDKVGVIFFSDQIEKFIPPKKGSSHILRIIRELVDFEPKNNATDIAESLRFLTNAIKKRCTTFILSDFLDAGFEKAITIANKKHDITAIKVYDIREKELPGMGLMKIRNAETGEQLWIDSNSKTVRKRYHTWWLKHNIFLQEAFNKSGVDHINISTTDDYVKKLLRLFQMRENRRQTSVTVK